MIQQRTGRADGLELVTKNGALVLEKGQKPESRARIVSNCTEKKKKELADFLNSSELMNVYPELDMEQLEAIIWAEIKKNFIAIRFAKHTLMPFLLLLTFRTVGNE